MSIDFSGGLLDNKTLLVGPGITGSYYNMVTTFATDNNENTSHSIKSGENTIYYEFPEPVDIKRYKVIRSYKTGELQYILDGEELVRKLQIADYDGKDVIVDLKNVKKVGLYAVGFKTIEFNVYDKLPPVNKYLFKDGEEIKKYVRGSTGVENIIPTMTSNIAPTGIASSSSENGSYYAAWKAFNKQVGSDEGWMPGGKTGWIGYEFDEPKVIAAYGLYPPNSSVSAPGGWIFEGWNGSEWITLNSQSGVAFTHSPQTIKYFTFENTTAYKKYRINVTEGAALSLQIGELEMFEQSPSEWIGVGLPPVSKELFDLQGMSDLSIITNEAIQQLQSDQVELLCWTDEDGKESSMFVEPASNVKTANGQINSFAMNQEDYYHSIVSITKGSAS